MEEKENLIIIDASFFVALYFSLDPNHYQAAKIIDQLEGTKHTYTTNNYLISEAVTMILLRSKSLPLSSRFAQKIFQIGKGWFEVYQVNQKLQSRAFDIFRNQKKYQSEFLSFVDCTLLAQARQQKIKTILTFDQTFSQFTKKFRIIGKSVK